MIYSTDIVINLPVEKTVRLFDSSENLKKWQPGLIGFTLIEGTEGERGARSRLVYKMGKKTLEMTETIEVRDLPGEFTAVYEAKGVWNRVSSNFIEAGDKTLWVQECEFRCTGFMRIWMKLLPGSFKKQTLKDMNRFREFAENQIS